MKKIKGILFLTAAFCYLMSTGFTLEAGQISKDEALDKFVKAGFAYKDGQYREAASLYEEVLARGLESGPLYYNLANSYVKQNDLGRAILNYERARRFMPRDTDLMANYRFAKTLLNRTYPLPQRLFWQKAVDHHVQFYTRGEFLIFIYTFAVLFLLCHLLSLYRRWPRQRTATALFLCALLFTIFLAGYIIKGQGDVHFAIVLNSLEAKFEPREGGTTHFELYPGAKIKVIKSAGEWSKIERLDGKQGWMLKDQWEEI